MGVSSYTYIITEKGINNKDIVPDFMKDYFLNITDECIKIGDIKCYTFGGIEYTEYIFNDLDITDEQKKILLNIIDFKSYGGMSFSYLDDDDLKPKDIKNKEKWFDDYIEEYGVSFNTQKIANEWLDYLIENYPDDFKMLSS